MERTISLHKAMHHLLWLCVFILGTKTAQLEEAKSSLDTLLLQHVQIVTPDSLQKLKLTKSLSLVYFDTSAEFPTRQSFLTALDDSAKYLAHYNIDVAVVNCASAQNIPECKEENVGKNIHTYQNGEELMVLELDTMFDINSIMSNSLQLLLLRQVPIVESLTERGTQQSPLRGKQDLLYFYTRAIGTMEHRVFMEIAYAYQDRYKFAITAKLDAVEGLQSSEDVTSVDRFALWILHCSKSSAEDTESSDCYNSRYKGQINLPDIADYVERLAKPNLLYAPENGTSFLFEDHSDVPVIIIFTNSALKEQSDSVSNSLAFDVKGYAKVFVIDVEDGECSMQAARRGFDGHVPGVAVSLRDGSLTFLNKQNHLDLSAIIEFFDSVTAALPNVREEPVKTNSAAETVTQEESPFHEVEIQDDEVAKAVFKPDKKMPEKMHTPSVLKGDFHDVVGSADLKMVLYYLPFDTVSLALLNDFEAAAQQLSSPVTPQDGAVARVNCFDATDLCARENITTYPVIRIHRNKMPYTPYEGQLNTDSLVRAVALLKLGFPLTLKNEEELHKFAAGMLPPMITDLSPSLLIFVARKEDKGMWATFRAASRRLDYLVAMARVADDALVDVVTRKYDVSVPCVISIHHSDTILPIKMLQSIASVDDIITFARQSRIATMPELTESNFPALRARNLPFVILFLNQSASSPDQQHIRSTFTDMAGSDDFRDSIFCWMDGQNESMGHSLLLEYTGTVRLPSIVVVDHKKAQVFTQQSVAAMTQDQISEWLRNIFSSCPKPSKTLKDSKWLPPGPHFDFLAKIDKETEEEEVGTEDLDDGSLFSDDVSVEIEREEKVRRKLLEQSRGNAPSEETEFDDSDTAGQSVEDSPPAHTEL